MTMDAGTNSNPVLVPQLAGAAGATPARAANAVLEHGLTWTDRLTLVAIGVVVVLVSLPRIRSFALRENELDAVRMLRVLASQSATPGSDVHGLNLSALVARDLPLQRRLEDLELLADGHLRRHGYLFDVTWLAPGEPMLRAWPWNYGQTGVGAFVWTPQRGLLGHANRGGKFSGFEGAPGSVDVDATWRYIPRR